MPLPMSRPKLQPPLKLPSSNACPAPRFRHIVAAAADRLRQRQPGGGISEGEAKALEDASEMLDERRSLPPEARSPQAAPAEMTGDIAAEAGQ